MRPALCPGDLLALHAPPRGLPSLGQLVEVRDPRDGRVLIKRVSSVEGQSFCVLGDNQAASRDSRDFGELTAAQCTGVAWLLIRPEPFVVRLI